MKHAVFTLLALLVPLTGLAAHPGDAAAGKRLYDAHCTSCHDSSVFTRQNRRVTSLDALRGQVQACGHMAKQDFTPQQLQDLVKYLNERFYRFP